MSERKVQVLQTESTAYKSFAALDGLRGLSALAVVYHHICQLSRPHLPFIQTGLSYLGAVAVFSFFALSSFLLTSKGIKDWKNTPQKAQNATRFWGAYFIKRVARVYPLFLLVSVLMLVGQEFVKMPQHLKMVWWEQIFLIYPKGVFWTIPVEVEYYFFLPLIVIGYVYLSTHFSRKHALWLGSSALLLLMVLSTYLFPMDSFPLIYPHLPPYFAGFVAGSLAGIISHEVQSSKVGVTPALSRLGYGLVWGAGIALIMTAPPLMNQLLSWEIPSELGTEHKVHEQYWKATTLGNIPTYLSAILVLGLTWVKRGLLYHLLSSSVMRYFGKISFSVYLVHITFAFILRGVFGLEALKEDTTFFLYGLSVFAVTIFVAHFATHKFELPMNKLGIQKAKKLLQGMK